MKLIARLLLILTLCCILPVTAKPLAQQQVPKPLQPWINWVLHDNTNYQCPFIYNNFKHKRCSWPSQLNLQLQKKSGTFQIRWQVYATSWIQIPGNKKFWPQQVKLNGKTATVLEKNGLPVIKLEAGNYQLKGQFLWDYLPDNISIAADTGLINLVVNGKAVPTPFIKNGQLWLKKSGTQNSKTKNIQNRLDVQVFRKVIDDIPLQVITRLVLDVAGKQREVKLAQPMLKDFIAMRLQSPLPAKLEADGSLLVQLRPGHWELELQARAPGQIEQLPFKRPDKSWPDKEIWVFEARPDFRVVEIEQLSAIDPQQSNLPITWRNLPAYQIKSGQSMLFKVIRVGDPDPKPNQLDLTRKLWLDFDGQGYSVNDHIQGTMTQGWRLNVSPEMQLGHVEIAQSNQLITTQNKQHGIELRQGHINLSADSRITAPIQQINTSGWQQTFHHVKADLNLPPGWRLFTAVGVDNVPQSWVARWTLLDLFLVLIAALAVARLWNNYWGLFALLCLALIWHEAGAPRYLWLNILAAIALLRVIPEGRFYNTIKYYRNGCAVILLLMLIPFMIDQVRLALYPQLEKPWQQINTAQQQSRGMGQVLDISTAMEESMLSSVPISQPVRTLAKKTQRPLKSEDKQVNFQRIDPNNLTQTGPGLPQWQWQTIHLSWNGPVDANQIMSFWLISPVQSMLLNFARVFLVTLLALLLFGVVNKQFQFAFPKLLVTLLFLPCLLLTPQTGDAAFPDKVLLQQLQQRLLAAPDCLPACAQFSNMQVHINAQAMQIVLTANVQQAVALPLPAHQQQWMPNQVTVDGKSASALYRNKDGSLWIQIEPGQHQIKMSGLLPPLPSFALALPLKPHQVSIQSQDWTVTGLHDHGIVDAQLQFERIQQNINPQQQETLQSQTLPAFVRVERTLQLGLDWHVLSRVVRLTPPDAPIVLHIPLLTGESVTSAGIRIKNNTVLVNLPAGQNSFSWHSVLKKQQQLLLTAAQTEQWSELWRADISPIWHMQSSGITVVHHQNNRQSWLPEWRPWPGQRVTLDISRPAAIKGQTLTIDKSTLSLNAGQRNRDIKLELDIRSAQATQHNIQIPENALVQSISIDGKSLPIRQQQTHINLPIHPGKQHINVHWRNSEQISSKLSTPAVNLGINSINTHLNIKLGKERWILLTFGPVFGPAVLFWGVFIVLLGLAYVLGKITLTPLKHWQWFLLLIGLSQIPVFAALIIVTWFILLGVRQQKRVADTDYFNMLQIILGILTVITLILLFMAVKQGLLGAPDMQITGNQSSAYHLNWFQDRSNAQLPTASVVSLPLKAYRLLMLAWSLWLAVSLLNWLKWGWQCFSSQALWKKPKPKQDSSLVSAKTQDKTADEST